MAWTREQVEALAPDERSLTPARQSADPTRWYEGGSDERAVWGVTRGQPERYRVAVDLEGPAYRCTCPSRKFPCRHALALLLLWAGGAIAAASRPDEVAEWLDKRDRRARGRAGSPEAATERAAAREAKVTGGVEELSLWLADLVRDGLSRAVAGGDERWRRAAARMVDAQAPGLARRVRGMEALAMVGGAGWSPRLADAVGSAALLLAAARRQDELPAGARADVRGHLGWTVARRDVLAEVPVVDTWTCAGQSVTEDGRLTTTRSWLRAAGGRWALVLSFDTPGGSDAPPVAPGETCVASLAFYPGAAPLRALVVERQPALAPDTIAGASDLRTAFAAVGERLAVDPLTELVPVAVDDLTPVRGADGWLLRDRRGAAVDLHPGFADPWGLASLAADGEVSVMGEWDGFTLRPLGTWSAEGYTAW